MTMKLFVPWFLTIVLTAVAASECGALHLAAANVTSLEEQRASLSKAVEEVTLERDELSTERACDSSPDSCGMYGRHD